MSSANVAIHSLLCDLYIQSCFFLLPLFHSILLPCDHFIPPVLSPRLQLKPGQAEGAGRINQVTKGVYLKSRL